MSHSNLLKVLTVLSLLISFNPLYSQKSVDFAPTPSWVQIQDYSSSPKIDLDEISQGSLLLLADYQVNIPNQESYFRFTSKVTNTVGVQEGSNISTVYDPTYQNLIFHSITIIRNGEAINKLNPDHFQVIRRELNAERYLYDGSYTAMLNLSDVRVGDIIDMSYTIKGFNPIQNGSYSNMFYLSDYVPVGKINITLNSNSKLNFKLFNTSSEPVITKNDGLTTYNWTVSSPEYFIYEEYLPSWKLYLPTVIVTDYGSWKEVVSWANNVFKQSEPLSNNLQKKIEAIKNEFSGEGERIKAALNFVQNDIRYLGLEYGIGSYKPNSYNKVFDQRYGDCKDKSLLLSKMLDEMGISASPMLVNTSLKNTILELPPSPDFFDHCVVKVLDSNNNLFYYDPTINEQFGTYANRHFPNYGFGLEIREGVSTFDTIVSKSTNNIVTVEEFQILDLKGKANLSVSTVYSDVEADRMRSYVNNTSKSTYHQELENFYSNYYNNISLSKEPEFEDNQNTNEFIVKEFYTIDSIWSPSMDNPKLIEMEFIPASLENILVIPNLDNRKHPFEMPYPVAREHEFRIKMPQAWNISPSSDLITNDLFYYDTDLTYNPKNFEIVSKSYLKIQKPIVEATDFEVFDRDIKLLDKSYGLTIFIDKNYGKMSFTPTSTDFTIFIGVILGFTAIFIGGVILIIRMTKRK